MSQTHEDVKKTQYLLKPPVDLLEDFKKLADKNERSLNGEIIYAMRQHLAQHKRATTR